MNIKQSVLIVTYNHQEYIEECLNSIVNQTELPYEVVISDDSSKDNTWKIIEQYKNKFPNLFKIHRNEKNLGIFENIEKVKNYAEGNVINYLAGDDLYKPQTIEKISEAIKQNDLNPDSDKFIIALNTIHLYTSGKETIWNNYREKRWSYMSLRLRFGLSYRSVGLSKSLIDRVPSEQEVLKKHSQFGLGADWIKGFEEVRLANKIICVNYAGPVYRLGSGITSKASKLDKMDSQLRLAKYIENAYLSFWDKSDLLYLRYLKASCEYVMKPSVGCFVKTFYYAMLNINNFSNNYPWIRSLNIFLPNSLYPFFKFKVYTALRSLRKAN